jgi:cell division protein FtsA
LEILDAATQEYKVGTQYQIDPVGIQSNKIEGNFLNILCRKSFYRNLNKCFENAKIAIAEMYLAPIALAQSVLTEAEKRSGCMLVDLGAETTTVVVYYKNIVRHIAVIPLGSNNITKDLCSLNLEEPEAESLKIKYASAFTDEKDITPDETYKVNRQSISAVNVIDFVEARMEEIITNVWNQVPAEYAEKLLGGIILTGGGAQMQNINVAFRNITNIEQIRIAKDTNETFTSQPLQPSPYTHNTLVGLLAKGDQNCCADVAVQKTKTDIFNQPEQPVAPQPAQSPSSSPAFDIKSKDDPAKKEAATVSEEDRLIQEYRQKKEKREQEKDNSSFGKKISRWIQALTNPEE